MSLLVALSGSVTGTSSNSQSKATSFSSGLLTVTGTGAGTQIKSTSSATGSIANVGTSSNSKTVSTSSASGLLTVTGTSSQSQTKSTSQAFGDTEVSGVSGTSDCIQSIHISYSEGHVQNGIIETGSPGGWVGSKHRWPDVSGVATSRVNRNRSSASGLILISPVIIPNEMCGYFCVNS